MKQFRNHLFIGLIISFGLFLASCDKEKSPTSNQEPKKPTSPQISFDGPSTQSTNTYAQQAKGYSQSFNSYASIFKSLAEIPGGTQNGNTWTNVYTVGNFSETITIELLTDGSYKWKIIFNGSEQGGSVTYSNWTAIEGTSSADGKIGSLKFFEENSTVLEVELAWSTDAQGNETGILKSYNNSILEDEIDIVNNVDGSGSLKYYSKKSSNTQMYLQLDISWIANGTGTYKVYNEVGTMTAQGVF